MSVTDARAALWRLLGGPPRDRGRVVSAIAGSGGPGYRSEHLLLSDTGLGDTPGLLTWPAAGAPPYPAILYLHAHGNRYEIGKTELVAGRPSLRSPPYAQALGGLGIAALALDMPCFGERAHLTESATAKTLLWRGDTLFGQMLRECVAGLDVLAAHPAIDARKIGAFGLSMGSTLAWWLAALDARVAAVADLCCFADLGTLVATGGHDLHGIYMTVPGLLPAFRSGQVAGLAAPRPKFVGIGADDPLTPPQAVAIALSDLRTAYASAPDALEVLVEPGSGHVETARMRSDVLAFFERQLAGRG